MTLERWLIIMSKIEVKIKDNKTGYISEPVSIVEFIVNPYDINFVFKEEEGKSILPYKDFQYNIEDFNIHVTVNEKEFTKDEEIQDN